MNRLIQSSEAWQLRAVLERHPRGNRLSFISFVPSARHPREHNQFVLSLSDDDIVALRDFFNEATKDVT